MTELYSLPSTASEYTRLNHEIELLLPRVTEGSTTLFDYNRLLVQRRQLWMKANGLGPR